jgi:hypothetical protein
MTDDMITGMVIGIAPRGAIMDGLKAVGNITGVAGFGYRAIGGNFRRLTENNFKIKSLYILYRLFILLSAINDCSHQRGTAAIIRLLPVCRPYLHISPTE